MHSHPIPSLLRAVSLPDSPWAYTRDSGHVLLTLAARPSNSASWRQVNSERYSAGKRRQLHDIGNDDRAWQSPRPVRGGQGRLLTAKRYATTAGRYNHPAGGVDLPAALRAVTTRPQQCVCTVLERAINPKPALVTLTLVPNSNARRQVLHST